MAEVGTPVFTTSSSDDGKSFEDKCDALEESLCQLRRAMFPLYGPTRWSEIPDIMDRVFWDWVALKKEFLPSAASVLGGAKS